MSDELPIGQQLRLARERAGVQISELSERAKVARQTVHDIEKGNMPPSERILLAYSQVCKLKSIASDTLFLNAGKTPPDVFALMRDDPELCETLREITRAHLLAEGG